jgi:hypothetical protein
MPFTQYGRQIVLKALFTDAYSISATQKFLGLFTGHPGDSGVGYSNELNPITAVGYVRQALTGIYSNGFVGNNGAVTFTSLSGSWPSTCYFGVFDAATPGSGNLLSYGPISDLNSSQAQTNGCYMVSAFPIIPGGGYQVNDSVTLPNPNGGTKAVLTVTRIDTIGNSTGCVTGLSVVTGGSYNLPFITPLGQYTTSGNGVGLQVIGSFVAAPLTKTVTIGSPLVIAPGQIIISME